MSKKNRTRILITDTDRALQEMENALTLLTELDEAFRIIGPEALNEEPTYIMDDDNGRELRF